MLRIEPKKSINSHSILLARIVLSKDSFERAIFFTEKTNGDPVMTYVLSREQVNKLESLGINVRRKDSHHFAQKILGKCLSLILGEKPSVRKSKAIKCGIEFKSDSKLTGMLKAIKEEVAFNLIISLPYDIHQIYNRIFRKCLIPEEVLSKLNLILKERELSGNFRNDIIDLFSFVAVFVRNISDINVEEVKSIKNSNNIIATADLLDLLGITEEDVQKYISDFFLYPEHWNKAEHFKILSCLYKNGI